MTILKVLREGRRLLQSFLRLGVVHWDRFWFHSENQEQVKLFSRLLGAVLLFAYSIRSLDLELYFSDRGIAPLAMLSEISDMQYRFSILHYFSSLSALWILNSVFLISLLLMVIGVLPSLASIVAWVLHLSFLHRNPGSFYGVDSISTFYLFFFCIADFRKKPIDGDWRAVLGSVAFRLCQLQLCIIYFYAGIHKLKGMYWWRGEAVWGVLANAQMARWDFSWVAHFPLFITFCTYVTLLFEIYFPVLIWGRRTRIPFLITGALFHLGIAVTMNIPIFAAMMTVSYTVFFTAGEARRVNSLLEKALNKIQVPRRRSEENYV